MSVTTIALSRRSPSPAALAADEHAKLLEAAVPTPPQAAGAREAADKAAEADNSPPNIQSFLKQIAAFIPGDAFTPYLAGISVIRSKYPDDVAKCPVNKHSATSAAATTSGGSSSVTASPEPMRGIDAIFHHPQLVPWPTGEQLAFWVFVVTLALLICYVVGLSFLASKDEFVFPWWPVSAAVISFLLYAPAVDDIFWGCPGTLSFLTLIFGSSFLAFLNQIIARLYPSQAIVVK